MLQLIRGPLAQPDLALPVIQVRVDRRRLAKRLWRGTADNGVEFGFELETPLKHEQAIWEADGICYVITQEPEAVLEIDLTMVPSAAAGIGWAIGNLHQELSAEPTRLLTPDDPATRQLLGRIGVGFSATTAVFRPGRFARGDPFSASGQEFGTSHRH